MIRNHTSFNPLNQVYVFNVFTDYDVSMDMDIESFNPLNQVYVFNRAGRISGLERQVRLF